MFRSESGNEGDIFSLNWVIFILYWLTTFWLFKKCIYTCDVPRYISMVFFQYHLVHRLNEILTNQILTDNIYGRLATIIVNYTFRLNRLSLINICDYNCIVTFMADWKHFRSLLSCHFGTLFFTDQLSLFELSFWYFWYFVRLYTKEGDELKEYYYITTFWPDQWIQTLHSECIAKDKPRE